MTNEKTAYLEMIKESRIKAVKFTDLTEKPTKITIARKESDLDDNTLKAAFKKVMSTGAVVEMGKIYAEPLTESKLNAISEARRITIKKLGDPIATDAISILSKVKAADKYTDKKKFDKQLSSNKYFSASMSHVYDSEDDYKKGTPNSKSVIMKDVGDLVAVWDDKNSIGYIIQPDKLKLESKNNKKQSNKLDKTNEGHIQSSDIKLTNIKEKNIMKTASQAYKESYMELLSSNLTNVTEAKNDFKTWLVKNISLTGNDKSDVDELEAVREIMKAKGWKNILSILDKYHVSPQEIENIKDAWIEHSL